MEKRSKVRSVLLAKSLVRISALLPDVLRLLREESSAAAELWGPVKTVAVSPPPSAGGRGRERINQVTRNPRRLY